MPKILDEPVRADVISLVGELDMVTAPALRSRLMGAAATSTAPVIALDLSRVSFLDAQCAGIIASAWARARVRGQVLRVDGLHGTPKRVFELLGLASLAEGSG
ncbi:STAS domain-containing protein [Actinoplanes subtropicus]|uniref:STAS domain-containing protein n=1 Tax=Actinoplanes subtropicus TaxID=543632 RepID=UPI0006903066|nr:STAS domain-containing protein [Actinoplanes subtropicus]